jgi:hypothetical protein
MHLSLLFEVIFIQICLQFENKIVNVRLFCIDEESKYW